MLTKEEIKSVLSRAYAEAALQEDYNMRTVADLYENLRPQLYEADPSDAWDFILLDNSKFDSETAVQAAVLLREVYFKAYITRQLTLLKETAKNNPSEVAGLWNVFYADAAIHYRDDFICMLCLQRATWDDNTELINEYASLTKIIEENNWADAYSLYDRIACDTALSNKIRMQANVTLAQIIIYHYPQIKDAEKNLSAAEKLMPDNFIPKKAWSEYALKNGDSQKARNGLLQVITQYPSDFNSFNYIGDSYMAEGNLESARSWYSDAIQRNFLQAESYKRLINLYADKKLFAESQAQIDGLLKKIEERRWYRNMTVLIEHGLATQDCFKNSELYHAYRDVAAAWFTNDNMEKAEEWYVRAIELQPSFTPAFIDLAYLQIRQKGFDKAKDYLLKALALNKLNYEVHWALAYFYEQNGKKDEALREYEECLQIRPQWNDWIYNFIGNLYYSYEEFEMAAAYFRKAIVINDNSSVYKENLADALGFAADALSAKETEADDKKAEAFYREATDISNTAESWSAAGSFYFKKQRWQEAIDNFTKATLLNDKDPVYYGNIALAYEKLNDVEKTEEWYGKAIKADEKSGSYQNRLGLFYYYRKEFEKAIQQYEKALEREPEEPDYLDNICIAYEEAGQADKAEPYYIRLLQKDPDNHLVMNMLGVMYYKRGNYENALTYYKMAILKNGNEGVYRENLALLYRTTGKNAEAAKELEALLALNPKNDTNWNNLGVIYAGLNEHDKALECYDKAVELAPGKALYYENKAITYEKKLAFSDAIEAYRKALHLNSNESRYLNAIGLIYYNTGDYANAIDHLQKAVTMQRDNWLYLTDLGLAYTNAGLRDEAIAAYEEALRLNENDYLNWNELGILFREKEEYDKSVEAYRRAAQLKPNDAGIYYNLASALYAQGKEEEAMKTLNDDSLSDDVKVQLQSMLQQDNMQPESKASQ